MMLRKAVTGVAAGLAAVVMTLGLAGCGGDNGANSGEGGGKPSVTTFTDSRDNTTYKKVKIGNQTWMAENLSYDIPDNTDDICINDACLSGRGYTWDGAMNSCPAGWHLPSDAEWTTLTDFVGGASTAGTKLKSKTGWNGTDDYGFSAIPTIAQIATIWWSATEVDADNVMGRQIHDVYSLVYTENNIEKTRRFWVRCVQD